jgi:hypothetical protein
MGCKGCSDHSENPGVFDSRGNKKNIMEQYEEEVYSNNKDKQLKGNMPYTEYKKKKSIFRNKSYTEGDAIIKTFSEDYKRIQVDELIAVYNNEEVHRLCPTQALVMLHELVHHRDYQKVINEFLGLREQVDTKYEELMKQRINVVWKP